MPELQQERKTKLATLVTLDIFHRLSCAPQGEEAAIGPSVEELAQAQYRVREQDELEEELEVVRQPDGSGIQRLKKRETTACKKPMGIEI